MATYQTPGVYVEEISTLPPSVAQVATAIPAFIGYTEKGPTPDEQNNVEPQVARLNTMLEFETLFGGARSGQYEIGTRVNPTTQLQHVSEVTRLTPDYEFLLYYVLSLYFKNGGGSCYVVSVGTYETTPDIKHFEAGLRALEKEDEPTLIMLTDATHLGSDNYYNLCGQALEQCRKLRDRFAILDVVDGAVDSFRNASSLSDNLMYGAAYHPYLQTLVPYKYRETDVTVVAWEGTFGDNGIVLSYRGSDQPAARLTLGGDPNLVFETTLQRAPLLTIRNVGGKTGKQVVDAWKKWRGDNGGASNGFDIRANGSGEGPVEPTTGRTTKLNRTEATVPTWEGTFGDNGIVVSYTEQESAQPAVQITPGNDKSDLEFKTTFETAPLLTIDNVGGKTGKQVVDAWKKWRGDNGGASNGFDIRANGSGEGPVEPTTGTAVKLQRSQLKMESIRTTETALYNQIKAELNQQRVILPPSAAVAGIYARVDRERGVWKAPANVGVASVLGPVRKITHEDQETLNVDFTGGKSINAIRAFTGKGTLVWGARTLAGNDNEWRYVPVRRLFIMIEESIQKATAFAVFEPNDAATWLKVKAMIESYLYGLWEQGALAGSTPEVAYFVQIGLGKTMTPQDVLEGRMIVEVGVAAVRPAEFILLRFTHNLQEA